VVRRELQGCSHNLREGEKILSQESMSRFKSKQWSKHRQADVRFLTRGLDEGRWSKNRVQVDVQISRETREVRRGQAKKNNPGCEPGQQLG